MLKINAPKDFLWFSQKMAYLKKQFSHIMKQLDIGSLEERDCSGTESERKEDLSLDFEGSGERNLRYRHTSWTCAKKEEIGIYSKILYKLISTLTSVFYYKELFCSVATIGLDKALKWI